MGDEVPDDRYVSCPRHTHTHTHTHARTRTHAHTRTRARKRTHTHTHTGQVPHRARVPIARTRYMASAFGPIGWAVCVCMCCPLCIATCAGPRLPRCACCPSMCSSFAAGQPPSLVSVPTHYYKVCGATYQSSTITCSHVCVYVCVCVR